MQGACSCSRDEHRGHADEGHAIVLLVLGELVEAVGELEHEVARRHVGVGFGASLFIDGETSVAQLSENIEAFSADGEVCFGYCARERHVPNHFVAVHLSVCALLCPAVPVHAMVSGSWNSP